MKLLTEIRDEAVDGGSDIATLLRKCQVLASVLRNVDFKRWVSCELNGYHAVKDLPRYRIMMVASVGTFFGRFGSSVQNAPLPVGNLPKKIADELRKTYFFDGVGTLQHLVAGMTDAQLHSAWSADVIALYQDRFYKDMNLVEAHKIIPKSAVSGILEIVRNKVLDFVLEIGHSYPDISADTKAVKIKPEVVQNTYNTYILGDGNRVAAGCGPVEQNVTKFEKGNWAYLEGVLKQLKVAQDDITELKRLLKANPPKSKSKLGDGVNGWLGGIGAKAAQAGYDIPIGIGLAAILKYCGLN